MEPGDYRSFFLTISVTDTGPGMKPSELGRLFQRFSQIEPVFSIKAGGSGLVSIWRG
jgi:signal transduction histidine kinase